MAHTPSGSDSAPTIVDSGPPSLDPLMQSLGRGQRDVGARQALAATKQALFGKGDAVRLGRYIVLSTLGFGGMGVVYEAYDPDLDRRVALKILQSTSHEDEGEARARLLREAKAIAKLNHPNVVAVYDVGTSDDQIFVAMELVKGMDLSKWLAGERSTSEVLEVFKAAGRGLEAAHLAGLVHRDFKPLNVLVGDDGRTRVLDFGLARRPGVASSGSDPGRGESDDDDPVGDPLATPLTREGTVMGTPPYMAPEQHAGVPADPRADQYAFCISLYEALAGHRPFTAKRIKQLRAQKLIGVPDRGPSEIPGWIYEIVRRGLRPDPELRYRHLADLLEDLNNDPALRRRRRIRIGAAGLLGVAAVSGGVAAFMAQPSICDPSTAQRKEVWSESARERVHEALARTELPWAEATFTSVDELMARWSSDWVDGYQDACEATHIRHEQSPAQLDLRMACLHEHRVEARALIEVLAEADVEVASHAVELVTGVGEIANCADPKRLATRVEPPSTPADAERVAALREELARVAALRRAKKLDDSLAGAQEVLEGAQALAYAPLIAETKRALGQVRMARGEFGPAEELLRDAYWMGVDSGHDQVAAQAAVRLVLTTSEGRVDNAGALDWARHAKGWLGRVGEDRELEADLYNARGTVHEAMGDHDQAMKDHERALLLRRELHGGKHPSVAASLTNLGNVHESQGNYEESQAKHEQALAILRASLGDTHPSAAIALHNLGVAKAQQGRLEEAEQDWLEALAMREKGLGNTHPETASSLANLATVASLLGRPEQAKERASRALEINIAVFGETHTMVAASLDTLASIENDLGDEAAAARDYERAIAIKRELLGEEHESLALSRFNYGSMLAGHDRAAAGLEHQLAALAIWEQRVGPDHPTVLRALDGLAVTYGRLGDAKAQRQMLTRAITLAESLEQPHEQIEELRKRLGTVPD